MNENENKLSPKEVYDLKKQDKEKGKKNEKAKENISKVPKKIIKTFFYLLVTAAIIGGIVWIASQSSHLPTTSMQNHVEESPLSHILTTPMPDRIQRHMLEHADGGDIPGILIQYNCDDYSCEDDLVQKLTTLVEEYPENVYLSPNNYDGKIILTKLGKIETLDQYDEEKIRNFIE